MTTATPDLKTWMGLFDLLETPQVSNEVALTQQFTEMCTQQGLTPSPAQVKTTVEHYLAQQAAGGNPPVDLPASASFRLWLRPSPQEREALLKRLNAKDQDEKALKVACANPPGLFWLLCSNLVIGLAVGLFAGSSAVNYVERAVVGVLFGLAGSLFSALAYSLVYACFKKRRHARRYADVKAIQEAWGAPWDPSEATRRLSPCVPDAEDMQDWLNCPSALAALRLLNQEEGPLLGWDAKHLFCLVEQWKQQKEQAKAHERTALEAAWRDLVGTRLIGPPADEGATS